MARRNEVFETNTTNNIVLRLGNKNGDELGTFNCSVATNHGFLQCTRKIQENIPSINHCDIIFL